MATYIPLSAGGAGERGPSIAPPDTPSLYALGGADDVVGTAKVERYWERRAKAPKRLVVIAGAGHTSPTDLCDIGNGGLVQTAIDAGVPIPPSFGSLYDCAKPVALHGSTRGRSTTTSSPCSSAGRSGSTAVRWASTGARRGASCRWW